MPHFDDDGNDTYLCQFCGCVLAATPANAPTYVAGKGNKCPKCVALSKASRERGAALLGPPMSVYEHCRLESGLTGLALDRYVNRYYGHN